MQRFTFRGVLGGTSMLLNNARWWVIVCTAGLGACASSKPPAPAPAPGVVEEKRVPCPVQAHFASDMAQVKQSFKEELSQQPAMEGDRLRSLLDAWQVGSLHRLAAWKLEAMAEFIEEGHVLHFKNLKAPGETLEISRVRELAELLKSLDPAIDLMNPDC